MINHRTNLSARAGEAQDLVNWLGSVYLFVENAKSVLDGAFGSDSKERARFQEARDSEFANSSHVPLRCSLPNSTIGMSCLVPLARLGRTTWPEPSRFRLMQQCRRNRALGLQT